MGKSNGSPVPVCMLAHEMINRLSVIIGSCDIVGAKIPADSDCVKHLLAIRESARVMAAELGRHQCELNGLMRTTVMEKGKFLT